MIKFFRNIRQNVVLKGSVARFNSRPAKYLIYAVGEILLVVLGILIALQINNWNQDIKEEKQAQLILKKLETELQGDLSLIQGQISTGRVFCEDFRFCLDVLSNRRKADEEEFRQRFASSVIMTSFDINKTTFNSITQSRTIDYLSNDQLVDSLNAFYNSRYKGWDIGTKDYTRNVIGPFLMQFDHWPEIDYDRLKSNSGKFSGEDFSHYDISNFEVKGRSIEDYKKDVFIINLLRQRLFFGEAQLSHYQNLSGKMQDLLQQIQREIDRG